MPASSSRRLAARLDRDPAGCRDGRAALDVRDFAGLHRAEHAFADAGEDGLAPLLDLGPVRRGGGDVDRPSRRRGGPAAAGGPRRAGSSRGCSPTFRHVPPTCSFSIMATDAPRCAQRLAARNPPGPAPITTTSNRSAIAESPYSSLSVTQCRVCYAHRLARSINQSPACFQRFCRCRALVGRASVAGLPFASRGRMHALEAKNRLAASLQTGLAWRQELKLPDRRAVGGFEDVQADDSGPSPAGSPACIARRSACPGGRSSRSSPSLDLQLEAADAVEFLADGHPAERHGLAQVHLQPGLLDAGIGRPAGARIVVDGLVRRRSADCFWKTFDAVAFLPAASEAEAIAIGSISPAGPSSVQLHDRVDLLAVLRRHLDLDGFLRLPHAHASRRSGGRSRYMRFGRAGRVIVSPGQSRMWT